MFVNSLFKDYLLTKGLQVWNNESTLDLVCLEFNYGSRSFEEEIKHLSRLVCRATSRYKRAKINNDIYMMDYYIKEKEKLLEHISIAKSNSDHYFKKTTEELRKMFYTNGVDITYRYYRKDNTIKREETMHYKMLYRSTGKAKKGSCMFICDRLYDDAIRYLRMGIELDDDDPKIVEISAYSPLISSGIVGKIRINPKNILILKDVDRYFKTNIISVETDENKQCIAKLMENYELKNTLFDGQALIDERIFPSWGNGYVLLRQHFCKMAAFNTKIQKFFSDYFKDEYENAVVYDMFGNAHYAKDIELITTDNAMKWIKFKKSYSYWSDWVKESDNMFGVVKTAHKSKLGNDQRMSYQMVNSLDNNIIQNISLKSIEYIQSLKTDLNVFVDYLRRNSNFSNDYEVLIALLNHNPEFEKSTYFRDRRKEIIRTYVLNFKSGRVIQNADNLTIVGSPYAMLLYAATGDEKSVDMDDTFQEEHGAIQCYTERFNSDEYLAFFRSPFNSKNNLTYLHNVYYKNLRRYFNFGEQIIAVNMIGTDFQDRNNGSDQDSDFGYTTNQEDIVLHAKRCYAEYPTIVNNIPKSQNVYKNDIEDFALIDSKLAKSQLDIGESSNLAQIAQTYDCTFNDNKYKDYVCILSVLAQVAIDSAKRQFDVDLAKEIKRIKKDLNVKNNLYPEFWSIIKKNFSKKNINRSLICPMNKLCTMPISKYRSSDSTLPMSDFFIKHKLDVDRKTGKRIEELIERYSLRISDNNKEPSDEEYLLLRSDFDKLVESIRNAHISGKHVGLMSWLLDRAFNITPDVSRNKMLKTKLKTNKALLLKVLYEVNDKALLSCFKKTSPHSA